MSDSNRVKVRYARESTWGETPSAPNVTELRVTGESLGHRKDTRASNELRSDRQRTALLEVGQSADGDLPFELSWSGFEAFLETALRGTIASVAVDAASMAFTASAASGANFTNFQIGQTVKITGGANNGALAEVTGRTASTIAFTGTTLTASTASCTVTGRTLKNGIAKTSYFLEVPHEDLAAVRYFNGMAVDGLQLNIASSEIVTGVFRMQGKGGFQASTSVASGITSAGAETPLTAAVNVGEIREGGQALATPLQAITLNVGNNMRVRPRVGSKQTAQHGDGTIDVTATLNAYFEDVSLLKKFIDHTATSLKVTLSDENAHKIVISLPKVEVSNANPSTPGLNQDVFIPVDVTAIYDPVSGATIRMDFLT